jgi:hypothetical protein
MPTVFVCGYIRIHLTVWRNSEWTRTGSTDTILLLADDNKSWLLTFFYYIQFHASYALHTA